MFLKCRQKSFKNSEIEYAMELVKEVSGNEYEENVVSDELNANIHMEYLSIRSVDMLSYRFSTDVKTDKDLLVIFETNKGNFNFKFDKSLLEFLNKVNEGTLDFIFLEGEFYMDLNRKLTDSEQKEMLKLNQKISGELEYLIESKLIDSDKSLTLLIERAEGISSIIVETKTSKETPKIDREIITPIGRKDLESELYHLAEENGGLVFKSSLIEAEQVHIEGEGLFPEDYDWVQGFVCRVNVVGESKDFVFTKREIFNKLLD